MHRVDPVCEGVVLQLSLHFDACALMLALVHCEVPWHRTEALASCLDAEAAPCTSATPVQA